MMQGIFWKYIRRCAVALLLAAEYIRGGTAFREEDPRGGRATNRGAAWRGAGLGAQCRARCGGFRPGGGRLDPGHRRGGQGCVGP
ncbi:MAG: hypothetical protein ACLR8Y_08075 [Alistipes indistinctus]